jgi:hypothetical protein
MLESALALCSSSRHDDVTQRRQVGRDLAHHRGVVVVAEGLGDDCEVGLAEPQQGAHLALPEDQMERLDHGTDARECDLQEAELRPVGELHAHQVAGLDSDADQPRRQRVRGPLELSEAVASLPGDERHALLALCHALVEEVVQRPLGPVPRGAPALPVGLREAGIALPASAARHRMPLMARPSPGPTPCLRRSRRVAAPDRRAPRSEMNALIFLHRITGLHMLKYFAIR